MEIAENQISDLKDQTENFSCSDYKRDKKRHIKKVTLKKNSGISLYLRRNRITENITCKQGNNTK